VIGIAADLGGVFKPIERRLTCKWRAVGTLAGQAVAEHTEHRIVPQLVVIVDVFIAERDAENALAEHRRKLVDDERRAACIVETIGQPRYQADRFVGLAEQQRPRIRGDRAAIKRAHNLATLDGSKIKRIPVTLCQHRGVLPFSLKSFSQNNFR
jgi:hypothetical protein